MALGLWLAYRVAYGVARARVKATPPTLPPEGEGILSPLRLGGG